MDFTLLLFDVDLTPRGAFLHTEILDVQCIRHGFAIVFHLTLLIVKCVNLVIITSTHYTHILLHVLFIQFSR